MMQCPSCGETDLLPKFKLCPFCGFLLPCAQNELSKVEQGIVPTTVQQSHLSTRNNSDLGVDNRQNQGENQQQDVSTTEREQPQSSTGQHPGPTQQPNKDYVGSVTVQPDDTPTEERAGLSENDQRPEYTQPTSFDQGHEDAVGSKGAGVTNTTRETIGDQTDLSDAVPSTTPSVTPPLEGQAERISCSTDPHRGNVAPGGETAVTASSTSDNTKDENSAEAVRCPAVLEGSERDADSAEPKTTSEKSSDNRSQTMPDDQRQKLVNDSERKERDMTESGEDPPTAGATTTSTTPQQKPPETQTLLGSGSETEDSKTHAQNTDTGSRGPVTRQAANRGNPNQSNKTPSSVPQHPLDKPGNDDGVTETKEAESGTRYRKSDNQQQQTTGTQKSKKNQKKEEKGGKNAEQQPGQQPATDHRTQPPPPSLQQVKPEDGITVVFHVLLASNFKMMEESFFIRAHGAELGDFFQNCVDMIAVEVVKSKDKDRLVLFRGQFTISLDRARKGTDYKYVVVKKGRVHWEVLPEFPPKKSYYIGIVNRYLKIPDKHIEPGATWNQFDGVAYVYGEQTMFTRVVHDYFSKDKTVEYRTKALLCFLPKWRGFFVNEAAEKMDATEALVKLEHVVNCLSNVPIEESGYHRQRQPINFDVRKALTDLLKPKMEDNIAILAGCQVGSSDHVSAVVSSLAIILLVKKYKIELKREEVKSLLSCLSLEADRNEKRCSAYETLLAEFSTGLRGIAVDAIESLCNQLMKNAWASNPEWLLAVPLLHFLRGDSKPFEEPDIGGSPQNLAWWGAQKLSITEFQRSDKQDFSDVWPRLASAFEVDRLLKRTYLHAIPVWKLHEIVSTRMFHVSDVCVALVEFFPCGIVNKEQKSNFEKCVQAMINMLESGNGSDSSKMEMAELTVSSSLKLVEICLEDLSFQDDIDLTCLAIKLLFSIIQQWRNGPAASDTGDKEKKSQERESLIEDYIRQLTTKLGSKLKRELDFFMPDNYQRAALSRELKVWSVLLKVSDGSQGLEEYRRYLTEQFMYRAKKMRETRLVEIFCELDLEVYDRAVGESISKLAFEAVEKIIEKCHCKNTCRRKSGKTRGCPCREGALPCSVGCDCGPNPIGKPCSNKKQISSAAVARLPTSAFDRHQAAAAKSREEIGTFIQTITPEEKDRLLLELLSNGRGSLDYAKNLIAGGENDPNPEGKPETEPPDWCTCGVCRPMPTPEEDKCCGKRVCVTSYALFQNICIDREVLSVAIRARCDIRVEEPDYASNSFRKAAYRQFILWQFDKMGRGNRNVCPACVVRVVREAYPALDE